MKMKTEDFDAKLAGYVQEVLIPKCRSNVRKFMLGALLGTGKISCRVVPEDALKALGVVDDGGNVDTAVLRKAALAGMDTAGELYVAFLGMHFGRDDVDAFLDYVERGTPE